MKRFLSLMSMAAIAITLTACASDNGDNVPPAQEPPVVAGDSAEQLAATPEAPEFITVTHRSGVTEVPVNPQRVAIFDMGMLDTLDLLGVDTIIGLPQGNIPDYLQRFGGSEFINLGTLHEPNLEILVEQDPDLIIISGRARPMYDELSELAPTIDLGVDNSNIMETFINNNMYLGKIFDKEEQVREHINNIQAQIEEINQIAQGLDKTGLVVLHNDGNLSAFGPGSRFGIIHDVFGVNPVDPYIEVTGNHGHSISNEYIVANNPDMLFVMDRSAVVTGGEETNREDIENELVQLTNAYIDGNIFYLTPQIWYIAVGGLQGMQMQLDEIQSALENAN